MRLADVVDDVLVGRRVVAAGRFVAHAVRRLPIGIDVAGGQRRARLVVLGEALAQLAASGARGRGRPVEVERRWRGRQTMSSSWTVRRARSSAGALRAIDGSRLVAALPGRGLGSDSLLGAACACARPWALRRLAGAFRVRAPFRRRFPGNGLARARPTSSVPSSSSRRLAARGGLRATVRFLAGLCALSRLSSSAPCGLAFGHCRCPFGSAYLDSFR